MANPKNVKIILDAGHGGKDSGGGSNKYWLEKVMNLMITLYQFARLKALGFNVVLTRNVDKYLSPEKRTKIIRESGAVLCISNHINAGGGDGFEAIHSIFNDGKLANMIADEIRKLGQNVRRVFTRKHPRYKNKDYYYMHRLTGSVTTLILEYGFADSKLDDIMQIKNDWKKYAEGVIKAICDYYDVKYVPAHTSSKDYMIKGDSGDDVEELQDNLMELGYSLGSYGADGVYGNDTKNAVILFQKNNKLKVDGVAGKNTLAKIEELLNKKNEKLHKVQVGAFSNKSNAEKLLKELKGKGYKGFIKSE